LAAMVLNRIIGRENEIQIAKKGGWNPKICYQIVYNGYPISENFVDPIIAGTLTTTFNKST
jgi:hypothetical protein